VAPFWRTALPPPSIALALLLSRNFASDPVNCLTTQNGYSAFWAGLDGDFTSNTVEQTGTEADCSSGTASYYGWYEMYPKGSFSFGKTVMGGDSMSATVINGGGSFTLTLADAGGPDNPVPWTATTTQRLKSAKLASAEAIAEAPSSAGGVLPLADFGAASFTSSSLAPLNPQAITMVTSSGTPKATPSTPIGSNGSFTDTWNSAGP
jgi:Peptidase A4 family